MILHNPFLILCTILFANFIYFAPSLAQRKADEQAKKPNVLLIYTDDQGSLDMNIYGAKDLHTPRMDKLARNGVHFTQFYAAALCGYNPYFFYTLPLYEE